MILRQKPQVARFLLADPAPMCSLIFLERTIILLCYRDPFTGQFKCCVLVSKLLRSIRPCICSKFREGFVQSAV